MAYTVHGILQARILEWVAVSFSRRTQVSRIASGFFTSWTTREDLRASSVSSVAQSCQTLCDPMDCSTPGFPVHHQLQSLLKLMSIASSQSCHPPISSSIVPFSSHLQSFPASGSFQLSQFFASGGQIIGVSASASVLLMNNQDWFPLAWTSWISLKSKGLSKSLLQHHSSKASILWRSAFFIVQLSHLYMTTGKTIALTIWTFVGKAMSLLFNMLSSLVIAFLPRSKHLLISWLQSPSAVILELKKIVCHCFHCFPIYLPWSDGTRCHDLSFLNVEL